MWRRTRALGLVFLLTAEVAVIALPHDHHGELSQVGVDHRAAGHCGRCLTPVVANYSAHACLACAITATCFELPQEARENPTLPTTTAIAPHEQAESSPAHSSHASSRAPPYLV